MLFRSVAVHAHHSVIEAEQTAHELCGQGVDALAVTANVADESQVRVLIDTVFQHFGRIDALVNCAAIWNAVLLEDTTAADVRRHFDVNALGTFLCCQQAGLRMVQQELGGAIVNVGDWATVRPYVDYAAYFPSKGAIPALTRNMAVELGRRNPRVRVNAILPGPVMLPPDLPADERQAAINATLVKREGTPQHVADAAIFLIENDFITGVCLPVDGGRSIYAP